MPALAIVIPALLALLLAIGQAVTRQGLSGWLNGVPIVGGWLARTVQIDFGIFSWLWGQVYGFLLAVDNIHVNHATEQGLNVQAHSATHGAIQGIKNVTVPVAVQAGTQPISAALSELEGGVVGFIGQQNAWDAHTSAQIGAVQTQAGVILPAEIDTLRGQVSSDFTTITGQIATGQAQTERDIATASAGAQAGAIAQVEPQIGAIQTEVGSIANTVTQVLAPGLAGLLTLVPSLVGRIATTEECTAGICSSGTGNLLGDLGSLLNELTPLLEGGILFLLLAEAVRDPAGVAGDIETAIGGTVNGAATVLRDAIGLVA